MISILNFLIVLSFVVLAVIIWRKIPLLLQLPVRATEEKKNFQQRWQEFCYGDHWVRLINQLEKFLRRLKIWSLRLENLLGQWIVGLREKSQAIRQKSKKWIRIKVKVKEMPETEIERKVQFEKIQLSEKKEEEKNNRLVLSDLEKPTQEEQKWIDLIAQNPRNIVAYKELGLLYWRQHNYLDAKASFEVALKLGSKDKKIKELLEEIKKLET